MDAPSDIPYSGRSISRAPYGDVPAEARASSRLDVHIGPGATFNNATMNDVHGDQVNVHGNQINQKNIYKNALSTQLNYVASADIKSQSQDGCMPGTRVTVLQTMMEWSRNPDAPRIYWLSGAAGTGKSAIARSIARKLEQEKHLGGSFFCLRGNTDRSNARLIVPTLAYSLAVIIPKYRDALRAAFDDFAALGVAHWNVDHQVETVLSTPLSEVSTSHPGLVFVIDALDECQSPDDIVVLLKALSAAPLPCLPGVKFFLISRPEAHIRGAFLSRISRGDLSEILHLHKVEVKSDIRLYLGRQLEDIQSKNQDLPLGWPSEQYFEALVRLAGTLFISASTVIKYLRGRGPARRLQVIVGSTATPARPLTAEIDRMYTFIVEEATDPEEYSPEEIQLTKDIIAMVLAARRPLTLAVLAKLLEHPMSSTRWALDRLHAVIQVPEGDDGDSYITTYHASFADFMTSRSRSQPSLLISLPLAYAKLARRCMEVMKSELKFNIRAYKSSYLPDWEQELSPISPTLQYCCSTWPTTILAAEPDQRPSLFTLVEEFLEGQLLFWLEVWRSIARQHRHWHVLDDFLRCKSMPESLRALMEEATTFIKNYGFMGQYGCPHIYLSALPHLDVASRLGSCYRTKFNIPIITIRSKSQTMLPSGYNSYVAISSDGLHCVLDGGDNEFRVWDLSAGQPVMHRQEAIFREHATGWIIYAWDPVEGEPQPVLFPIASARRVLNMHWLASSPNGAHVLFTSNDFTLYTWNVASGRMSKLPLRSSAAWVVSALSEGGTYIAAALGDHCIHVWSVLTVELAITILVGHTNWVQSVAFSADGTRVVSCSYDCTIRCWDCSSGRQCLLIPWDVHPSRRHPTVLKFSTDGTHIIAGSPLGTIRIFDAVSGQPCHPSLVGHREALIAISFTPDGTRMISASKDGTVRIWDFTAWRKASCSIRPSTLRSPCSAVGSGNDSLNDHRALTHINAIEPGDGIYWLMGHHNERLMLLPNDKYLLQFPVIRIIPEVTTVTVDISGVAFGSRWTECYLPSTL
ncbi:hypothetical protein HGRIS_006667 [Hohenbuehelia grisea]|uniref:NACHT domain-containing protein n=1 Tax=Hohenbuehelia grisea TaxID=104357 RepID=A0ABR3JAR9_9AGAR